MHLNMKQIHAEKPALAELVLENQTEVEISDFMKSNILTIFTKPKAKTSCALKYETNTC